MQFPWRDFVWFTILIGLAIGLAVEQRRIRVFCAALDQATQSERQVYELGRQICDPAGGQMTIVSDTIFLPTSKDNRWITEIVQVPHVFTTQETDQSWVTGMGDLDFVLAMLLVMPILFAPGLIFRKRARADGFALANGKFFRRHPVLASTFLLISIALAVAGFYDTRPFFGTMWLFAGVFLLVSFIMAPTKLTPEDPQQIDENYEKSPFDFQALKAAVQLPLRDFFWLTMVIGLSVIIVAEHQKARELSEHPSRAEWWASAARLLQEKQKQLAVQPSIPPST